MPKLTFVTLLFLVFCGFVIVVKNSEHKPEDDHRLSSQAEKKVQQIIWEQNLSCDKVIKSEKTNASTFYVSCETQKIKYHYVVEAVNGYWLARDDLDAYSKEESK